MARKETKMQEAHYAIKTSGKHNFSLGKPVYLELTNMISEAKKMTSANTLVQVS